MVRVLDIYLVYYEWQCRILFTQYIIIYKYHPPSAIQGISKFPLLARQFAWLSPTRTPTSSRPNSSPVPVASLNKSFSLVTPRWSFNWLLNHWMIFYGWNIRSNPVAWNMTKTSKASTTNQGNFLWFPFYAPPPPLFRKKHVFPWKKDPLRTTIWTWLNLSQALVHRSRASSAPSIDGTLGPKTVMIPDCHCP